MRNAMSLLVLLGSIIATLLYAPSRAQAASELAEKCFESVWTSAKQWSATRTACETLSKRRRLFGADERGIAFLGLAHLYSAIGDVSTSRRYLSKAQEFGQSDWRVGIVVPYINCANALTEKLYDDAARNCKQFIAGYPSGYRPDAGQLVDIAAAHRLSGAPYHALYYADQAVDTDNHGYPFAAYLERALIYIASGDFQRALRDLDAAARYGETEIHKVRSDGVFFEPYAKIDDLTSASLFVQKTRLMVQEAIATPPKIAPQPDTQPQQATGIQGSGFFVNAKGDLISNAHVVSGCRYVSVRASQGNLLQGEVTHTSNQFDLALIATNAPPQNFLRIKSQASIREGQTVLVFGYPLSGLLSTSGNVSVGIISALSGIGDAQWLIQISAPVQAGSSGGPVVDVHGNLAGVVVSKLDAEKLMQIASDLPQNVNFAVSTGSLVNFLESAAIVFQWGQDSQVRDTESLAALAKSASAEIRCR